MISYQASNHCGQLKLNLIRKALEVGAEHSAHSYHSQGVRELRYIYTYCCRLFVALRGHQFTGTSSLLLGQQSRLWLYKEANECRYWQLEDWCALKC